MSKRSEKLKKYGHSRNVCLILYSRQRQKCYYCKTSLLSKFMEPHTTGKVAKEDLSEYWLYKKLENKFKGGQQNSNQ